MPRRNAFPETPIAQDDEGADSPAESRPAHIDSIEELALAWVASGKRAPQSPGPSWSCAVKGCRAIAFVRIDTALGRKPLCLCHFDTMSRRLRYMERAQSEEANVSQATDAGGAPI